MPKIDVYDIKGKKVSDVELNENVFGIEPNENIVHEVLINYLANQRQGTQSTKTRSEVRGGGRKPWRQKGTGRARQGSIRAHGDKKEQVEQDKVLLERHNGSKVV